MQMQSCRLFGALQQGILTDRLRRTVYSPAEAARAHDDLENSRTTGIGIVLKT